MWVVEAYGRSVCVSVLADRLVVVPVAVEEDVVFLIVGVVAAVVGGRGRIGVWIIFVDAVKPPRARTCPNLLSI